MAIKVGEIINASSLDIPHLKDLFKSLLILNKVSPVEIKETLILIKGTEELGNVFPIYDFLRCAFLDKTNAEYAITEGYELLTLCIKSLETYTEALGKPGDAETPV